MPDSGFTQQRAREVLAESMRQEGLTPKGDMVLEDEKIVLTPRETAVAQRAAELAIEELAGKFYRQVGETFVKKFFVWLGMALIGFAVGKGWLPKFL